jgi:hypothetical protein
MGDGWIGLAPTLSPLMHYSVLRGIVYLALQYVRSEEASNDDNMISDDFGCLLAETS